MPRKESPYWSKYCLNIQKLANGDRSWDCKFCGKHCTGTKTRMVAHLARETKYGVEACPQVPQDVMIEVGGRIHPSPIQMEEEMMMGTGCTFDQPASVAISAPISSIGDESASFSGMAAASPPSSRPPSSSHKQQTLKKGTVIQMQRKNYANVMEMRCIIEANLSFNLLKLPCWRNMLEAFSQIGEKHSGVSYHYMRNKGLKSEMHTLQEKTAKIRALWPKYGCTILTDGWVDVCHRQLVNVLVSCCYGTMFLKSIDCSNVSIRTDSAWLAEKISDAIKEIGSENVVQVVTDNASNCIRMGTILEEGFPHLVWTPCASHCLDLLLQDMGELPWMKSIVTKANAIVRLFGKKRNARKIFTSISSHALLKPCKTRFGVTYIVLARLQKVWSALEQTVVSDHWRNWPDSRKPDALNVKSYILDPATLPSFNIVLRVMGPLYSVLRLTDKEGSTIGLLYEFMRRSKDVLSKGLEEDNANKSNTGCSVSWIQSNFLEPNDLAHCSELGNSGLISFYISQACHLPSPNSYHLGDNLSDSDFLVNDDEEFLALFVGLIESILLCGLRYLHE